MTSGLPLVKESTVPGVDMIQVWHASTGVRAQATDLALLSAAERQRAARFRFEQDRASYVLGKRMTRSVLGRALALPGGSLEFVEGPRGKPAVRGADSRLTFNLAHSGTELLLAVSLGRQVGVDIERERNDLDLLKLAERYFCRRELEALTDATEPERGRRFFRYWTLKEAYLKAEGSGLGISLTAMDASVVPAARLAVPCAPLEDQPRGIQVQCLPARQGYAAALAADGPVWRTELREWSSADD